MAESAKKRLVRFVLKWWARIESAEGVFAVWDRLPRPVRGVGTLLAFFIVQRILDFAALVTANLVVSAIVAVPLGGGTWWALEALATRHRRTTTQQPEAIDEGPVDLGSRLHSRVLWSGRNEPDGTVTVGGPFCTKCKRFLGYRTGISGRQRAIDSDMVGPALSKHLYCYFCHTQHHFDTPSTVGAVREEAREFFTNPDHANPPLPAASELPIHIDGHQSTNGIASQDGAEYFSGGRTFITNTSEDRSVSLLPRFELAIKGGARDDMIILRPLDEPPEYVMDATVKGLPMFEFPLRLGAGEVRDGYYAFRVPPDEVTALQEELSVSGTAYRTGTQVVELTDEMTGQSARFAFGSEWPRED